MPAEKLTHELYGGEVVIDFWPGNHRYSLAGDREWLVSVTAATGMIDKSRVLIGWATGLAKDYLLELLQGDYQGLGFDEWRQHIIAATTLHTVRKDEAASIGSQVHAFAEAYALFKLGAGEMPTIPDDAPEPVLNGISAFIDYVNSRRIEFLHAERLLYSRVHGFVGMTDSIARIDGKLYVVDYKTSKGIYSEMWYQIAAYALAWNEEHPEEPVEGGLILHFDKETGNLNEKEFSIEDLQIHGETFLHCLALKKAEKINSK
jgi:hypothetical protein